MFNQQLLKYFLEVQTPFYYYDLALLRRTLDSIQAESGKFGFKVHYALKANANDRILQLIKKSGLGADCVSGNEILKALQNGFTSDEIVFAGVGKSDAEIRIGIDNDIFCFNCESIPEMEVIDQLAAERNKKVNIALRINPDVNAKTHHYITTGLEENKFGINPWEFEKVLGKLKELNNINLIGLHFHIGSQITDLSVFKGLCLRVNEIQKWFINNHIIVDHINVGGGLGVNYHEPDRGSVNDYEEFFGIFYEFLDLRPEQTLHFELGRAVVAQCGSLISKVLYIKEGINTNFAIVDAGMTELIRPALYQAFHHIENLSNKEGSKKVKYDVVGPICESSDCFGKAISLPETKRGDFVAIRTAGAYGEVMTSRYNLRESPKAIYSDDIQGLELH